MKIAVVRSVTGILAGIAYASIACAEQVDFSRYQVIIDKNLFGEPIPEQKRPDPIQPAQPVVQPFANIRLCGIHEERDGAWVSFVDVGVNPNRSSMVKVGEDNGDGIKVADADVVGGRALLKKGDEEKWLTMEQTAPTAPSVGVGGKPMGLTAPPFMRSPPPMPPPAAVPPSLNATPSSSIVERLRQRREALERMKAAATSAPPPAVTAPTNAVTELSPQERMRKLREYNIELIKAKGAKGPPLPIQLTPEEDDQLVKDGVLAPQPAVPTPQPVE